MIDLCVSIWWF